MKVLVATDKPFAPVAVNGIRQVVEEAGFELDFLYSVVMNVIKVNYGPLLKGGLQDLFKNLM